MDLVQSLGSKITFLPANLARLGSYSDDLQRLGIELIHAPFVLSLERYLRERGSEFELIYITRYAIATTALPLIERYAPQARLLLCNADLHHLRELRALRAAGLSGEPAERALAHVREVQRQEIEVMNRASHLQLLRGGTGRDRGSRARCRRHRGLPLGGGDTGRSGSPGEAQRAGLSGQLRPYPQPGGGGRLSGGHLGTHPRAAT